MADGSWSVAEAKAKFSEVIERAKMEGPQRVTKNGKETVIVVSTEEWARRAGSGRSLIDVLLDPAVKGSLRSREDQLFERNRTPGREPPAF
ncbi:MAG: type II toxin-antitoxin system Phd/YefM family antitoxin [Caulobacteraceae bacterium]